MTDFSTPLSTFQFTSTTTAPTTAAATTAAPPTEAPPTAAPPTEAPPTEVPTTEAPPTEAPTTAAPPTEAPTTAAPTTAAPPTAAPPTEAPPTEAPPTEVPTTEAPPTEAPTTEAPPTEAPTTAAPPTEAPTTEAPPTEAPTTEAPPTEAPPTEAPTTEAPKRVAPSVVPFQVNHISPPEVTCEKKFRLQGNGSSCATIANEYRLTLSKFQAMNPHINCTERYAFPGEEICIGDTYPGCHEYATVPLEYDTCSKIAQYLGISVTTLRGINPGLDCDDIHMSIFCRDASPPYCLNSPNYLK